MYFNYRWKLTDLPSPTKGKVFSCFAGGGGSSMGYKLAGYDVIGCLEIDVKLNEIYRQNFNPKFSFVEDIRDFNKRTDLPSELYNLDILDGSPPCSSFTFSGIRDKHWGKEKKFQEGQKAQVLDTLFFDFIELAQKLQPKIVIAENVTGILMGKAKIYTVEILDRLEKAGYVPQSIVLDASTMGIPQYRERVFFIALRKDLCGGFLEEKDLFIKIPKLSLCFNEPEIPYKDIEEKGYPEKCTAFKKSLWENTENGANFGPTCLRMYGHESGFSENRAHPDLPLLTITAGEAGTFNHTVCRKLTTNELILGGSFPKDYFFGKIKPKYVIGLSVPPIMMAKISNEIYKQWLSKLF